MRTLIKGRKLIDGKGNAIEGAAVILWSILPQRDRFEPTGLLLTSARHPDLFAEIERVSTDVQQPMPDEVYVTPEPFSRP